MNPWIKKEKELDDKRYALFSQHMYYLYGHGWENTVKDIPFGLADRVENAIREENEEKRKEEQQHAQKIKEEEAAREKTNAEKKATLTPEEYLAWKEEQRWKMYKENEEWYDQGFCDYSNHITMEYKRKEEGKIWLEERIEEGIIRQLGEGKFAYYAR
jgi:wobble nucleotide-excising tRNase